MLYFSYIGLRVPYGYDSFVIDERCLERALPIRYANDVWYLLSTMPSLYYLYGNEEGKMIVVYGILNGNSRILVEYYLIDVVLAERLTNFEECDCEFDLNDQDIWRLHESGIYVAPKEDTRLANFRVSRIF